jgi:hypothetical protein
MDRYPCSGFLSGRFERRVGFAAAFSVVETWGGRGLGVALALYVLIVCFPRTLTGEEETIELSAYEVTAQSAAFKRWKVFTSPHFVVYTDAKAKVMEPYLSQLEKVYYLGQQIFGREIPLRDPILLIMPTRNSDWRKLRARGQVEWRVAVNYWNHHQPTALIEYDWKLKGPYGVWAALGGIQPHLMGDPWVFPLQRGIGFFYGAMTDSKTGMRVGKLNPRTRHLVVLG